MHVHVVIPKAGLYLRRGGRNAKRNKHSRTLFASWSWNLLYFNVGTKSEVATEPLLSRGPTCGHKGYITLAVLGVPNTCCGDKHRSSCIGGIFALRAALRAHCALLLDYVPPEEPPSTPRGNALRIR